MLVFERFSVPDRRCRQSIARLRARLLNLRVCPNIPALHIGLFMAQTTDIAIVSGARTPMGRYCGKLRDFSAMDLAAVASQEAIKRSGVDPREFDHAVFGNAQQTSGDSLYGARHVALKAGLPIETPALTVNRLCGSGMQSLVNAA